MNLLQDRLITHYITGVLYYMKDLYLCVHASLYIYVRAFRAPGWGGVLWHFWKCRRYNGGWYRREGRAAQTSGQRSTAGGKKGAHHCQALLSEEQEGVYTLFTFTLIFIPEVYPGLYSLLHGIQYVEWSVYFAPLLLSLDCWLLTVDYIVQKP